MRITSNILLTLCLLNSTASGQDNSPADAFVTCLGDKLFVGEQEFRFISFNIPNLHYVEDDLAFDRAMPFRWPDEYEIEDALESVRQMGGRVVRIYTLSVHKTDDPENMPRHVLAPGRFNEEGFRVLDTVLEIARRKNLRVIIPFVDNWHWWGGVAQYAAFRNKQENAFWTDSQLIEDFKQTIRYVVTRVNTKTGIAYRDDPTILCWETGNELRSPHEWTRQITAYVKQLDKAHLVLDGKGGQLLAQESIDDPNVDFVQTHHYEKDPRQMIANIRKSAALAKGQKPYHVGEFGFICTEAMLAVMDAIIEEETSGGLAWSLRYHSRDGGFFWHQEPHGGDLFKAYHWPGFESGEAYDETRMLKLMRQKAFAISGIKMPPVPVPASPRVLTVTPGALITWQGAAGASGYDVQRAANVDGPWMTVGSNISDARVQYRPLLADSSAQPGQQVWYRVLARNSSGISAPSAPLGPTEIIHRTLVDELWNEGRMFHKHGTLQFQNNQSRKFKEDAHRLSGEKGAAVIYRVPEPLDSARLFLFAETEEQHLDVQVSADGEKFETVMPEEKRFDAGDAKTYGFWTPILYQITEPPPGTHFLRVEFQSKAQLSRVELAYGSDLGA